MYAAVKALALAGVALFSVSADLPQQPVALFVNYPDVQQVRCAEGSGTGFVAGGAFISVDHVTKLHWCVAGGRMVQNKSEPGLDFSAGPSVNHGYQIDCDGFKDGETYFAVGYANGNPVQRLITLTGTGQYDPENGEAVLIGSPTVIRGMSGGPVFSPQGRVVGTVNMFMNILPLSLSRELKDTSLCSHKPA